MRREPFQFGEVKDPPFFDQIRDHWPWMIVGLVLFLLAKGGKK